MNQYQEDRILISLYDEASKTFRRERTQGRVPAMERYKDFYKTLEKTVKLFEPDFNLERDLQLNSRALDITSLHYVLTLDDDDKKEQFKFYSARRNDLQMQYK